MCPLPTYAPQNCALCYVWPRYHDRALELASDKGAPTALRCSGRPTRTHQINTAKDRKPGPLDGIQDGVLFVTMENDQRIARRLQLMKALKTQEVERALN
uniref:Uncharacterized protein n=1 Tax=Oryza barthii TaxID=65489 RepID=A0A0D3FVW7_9ORYZ